MDKKLTTRILTYVGIVVFFLFVAYAFVPQVIGGKIVNQSDISGYVGMSHEMNQYNAAHPDDQTAWTNSMFGGMPTTAISAPHKGDWTQPLYDLLLVGKRPATYLFISLLGAFLLMLSLGINGIIAAGGAIAVTFCSYNIQIIQVGHTPKIRAIAFLPRALAAVISTSMAALAARKDDEKTSWKQWLPKTLIGSVLFALAVSFQVKANHQQITYYLGLMLILYAVVLLVWLLTSKERRSMVGRFFIASALLLVVGCVGIATNANKLIPLYKYTEHTMRGGSELSAVSTPGNAMAAAKTKGLDLDYATNWSYGWQELPNMMIPNFNGGSSAGAVNPKKSETYKLLQQAGQQNLDEISKNLPMYWGPQPFTAGPMYMGVLTVFLFILGLFLYKGKEKWWLVIATLLAIFLAVGNHFMAFTKLCYDVLPLYSKFRTVSMALIILQFTLPMLGFIVLDQIVKGEYSKKEFLSAGYWAFGLTAGFCLLCALMPTIVGSFTGAVDQGQPDVLVNAFKADRKALLVGDAWTSLLLICLAFILLLWGYSVPSSAKETFASHPEYGRSRKIEAVIGISILILINMFAVGKRYLNASHFTTPRDFTNQFVARNVDKMILADSTLSYRVADLTVSVFNDAHASYWHKSVGGYSPAKLQRYQDLIDKYLNTELSSIYSAIGGAATIQDAEAKLPALPVLSMLNTKYFILGADYPALENKKAFGNAWFVDSTVKAATPNDEIDGLGSVDLHKVAVIGKDFDVTAPKSDSAASADTIYMTSYAPNELHYHYNIASDRLTVFSEIYYPDGWTAWVDSAKSNVSLSRADWTLRCAVLPKGEHDLVMRFEPKSYSVGRNISEASSGALLLLLLLSIGGAVLTKKK